MEIDADSESKFLVFNDAKIENKLSLIETHLRRALTNFDFCRFHLKVCHGSLMLLVSEHPQSITTASIHKKCFLATNKRKAKLLK